MLKLLSVIFIIDYMTSRSNQEYALSDEDITNLTAQHTQDPLFHCVPVKITPTRSTCEVTTIKMFCLILLCARKNKLFPPNKISQTGNKWSSRARQKAQRKHSIY